MPPDQLTLFVDFILSEPRVCDGYHKLSCELLLNALTTYVTRMELLNVQVDGARVEREICRVEHIMSRSADGDGEMR